MLLNSQESKEAISKLLKSFTQGKEKFHFIDRPYYTYLNYKYNTPRICLIGDLEKIAWREEYLNFPNLHR